MVLDLSLSALLFWAAGMSKAGNGSLFLRLRLVLAAEPELQFGVCLRTNRERSWAITGSFTGRSQESGRLLSRCYLRPLTKANEDQNKSSSSPRKKVISGSFQHRQQILQKSQNKTDILWSEVSGNAKNPNWFFLSIFSCHSLRVLW